ncbi:MAG: PIN domain-containing protein [Anaerolineales bacterium]|nr:PIN domain-containing protein [Anaerolineales bacterium]NUQ86603.1 PIN domain-containing protein [Anaerolineales bacterium]
MRALIDTNVILDILLKREPFVAEAQAIWDANREGRFEGYVCAITPGTVFYIMRHETKSAEQARQLITILLQAFYTSLVDHAVLQRALQIEISDFEDAIQSASAFVEGLDFIVTRDPRD